MSTEERLKRLIGSVDAEARASEGEWNEFVRRAHGLLYMRRAAATLATVAVVGVVAFAAVSLLPGDEPAPFAPAHSPSASPEPTSSAPAENPRVEIPTAAHELWFVQGEKLSAATTVLGGHMMIAIVGDDPTAQEAGFWITFLLAGPLGAVEETGGTSVIPAGTELLGVERDGTTLFVDLSSEFESGGGSLSMQMRVAQVVYTGTQFEGIDRVRILIDGESVEAIGGEGIVVAEPLTRRDFQDVAPAIVVEEPRPSQEISSGDVVSGFANVFEANVSIRLLDQNGRKLLETFSTATCGTGCWGDFSQKLVFEVTERTEGRLEVLTYSAEDGSEQDVISIPVILVP